jgi:hypothetical protein
LRGEGFDVIAVAEDPGLLAASDAELYGVAGEFGPEADGQVGDAG